jgi:hypothetical protein
MGAWGSGHFENDEAMDWVWTLEHDTDGSALRAVLAPVAENRRTGEPPEVEASLALAAAAVVARARGNSREALPAEAEAWLTAYSRLVDADLVQMAATATVRVLGAIDGEPDSEDWAASVRQLAAQLTA